MNQHLWTIAVACLMSITACHINELKYINLSAGEDSGWRQVDGETKNNGDTRRVRRKTSNDPDRFDFHRDVAEAMKAPGVRAVVLSFTAHWSDSSQKEQRTWKALQEAHRKQGVVFLAVRVQDDANRDEDMDWPDKVFWDGEGLVAEAFGLSPKRTSDLPAAFLWSWPGALEVSHASVDAIQAKLRRLESENPKVLVALAEEVPDEHREGLIGAVEEELEKPAKLSLVWKTKEQNALKRLLAKARALGNLGEQRCNKPLTTTSKTVLEVDLQGRELVFQLEDIEERCLQYVGATRLKSGPNRTAVARAVQQLMDGLSQQAELPNSR